MLVHKTAVISGLSGQSICIAIAKIVRNGPCYPIAVRTNVGRADSPKRVHTCVLCQKKFVRLDLLQRHQQRHERGMRYRNSGGLLETPCDEQQPTTSMSVGQPERDADRHVSRIEEDDVAQQVGFAGRVDPAERDLGSITTHPRPQLQPVEHPADFASGSNFLASPYMLFDPANDAQGLTEEFDWLFENLPADQYHMDALPFDIAASAGSSSTSPSSPLAQRLAGSQISVPIDPWVSGQARLLSALDMLPPDSPRDSFFDPVNLQTFFNAYVENYDSHFPMIHLPSFSVNEAPPLLLIAILTLGATLSSNQAHYETAERIHTSLRWMIFSVSRS